MSDQLLIQKDGNAAKPLTKIQKQFNLLIEEIEQKKKSLKELQDHLPRLENRIRVEVRTLYQQYNNQKAELVAVLDRAYQDDFFRKKELEKLRHLILDLCTPLIKNSNQIELIPIYDRYAEKSYEEQLLEQKERAQKRAKTLFKNQFGVELEPEKLEATPEELEALFEAQLEAQRRAEEERTQQAQQARAEKQKSAKRLEKDAKKEAAAKKLSKSVKGVYATLVKAFHPDREPDEAEKLRKTVIMQEVIAAYEKNDLLALLHLQLQFEQIDQDHLNQIAEERLQHYIKVLQKQSSQLGSELLEAEQQLDDLIATPTAKKTSPITLDHLIDQDIKYIKKSIKTIKEDLKKFRDARYLEAFLKHYEMHELSNVF
jgi:archaellum component FlaC